jgi:hypothetical protein
MIFEPVFGEDFEIVAYLDDLGNEWTVEETQEYWDVSGNSLESQDYEPDESWWDADALASAGWGTDEDYGYYGE